MPVHERPRWAERAWLRALEEIEQGRQVYVVCPAISAGTREEGDDAEGLEPVSYTHLDVYKRQAEARRA